MVNKLKRKFVFTATISVAIALIAIFSIILTVNFVKINNDANNLIDVITDNGGTLPSFNPNQYKPNGFISPEAAFTTRYFSVILDKNCNPIFVNTKNISAITPRIAQDYARQAFNSYTSRGFIGNYKYSTVELANSKILVVFLDCTMTLYTWRSFLMVGLCIILSGILMVFVIASLISNRVMQPVISNYEKQKRFITDAGHEIKTPLTIIDATTDVIEMESGATQWTDTIHNQINRLTYLTNNLITLARMDEKVDSLVITQFSLSELITEYARQFEAPIYASNKTLSLSIEPDVIFSGDKKAIQQLISVLMDNAVKYSSDGGNISVSLSTRGKSKKIEITNTVDYIEKGMHNRLFDRFYRSDASRNSSTGGTGIGLSIAKAVTLAHNGKITASSSDSKSFTVAVIF